SIERTASWVLPFVSLYSQAINLLSGEIQGYAVELFVSRWGSPPSIGIRHSPPVASHSERYTIHFPSGLTVGRTFWPQWVSCLASEPSMLARQMSVCPLRRDWKTRKRPSAVTLGTASLEPGGVSSFALDPSASMIQIVTPGALAEV